jgi:hypothetical protein
MAHRVYDILFKLSSEYKNDEFLFGIIYKSILFILLCGIFYFLIINNNWLIKKILPDEEDLPLENQKKLFITGLRAAIVFYGLILALSSMRPFIYEINFFIHNMHRNAAGHNLSSKIFLNDICFNVFKFCLIFYMTIGAPGFVRWQVKRNFENKECSTNSSLCDSRSK